MQYRRSSTVFLCASDIDTADKFAVYIRPLCFDAIFSDFFFMCCDLLDTVQRLCGIAVLRYVQRDIKRSVVGIFAAARLPGGGIRRAALFCYGAVLGRRINPPPRSARLSVGAVCSVL